MFVGFRRCLTRCDLFFFNDTATTEIYTLSLHDALPISSAPSRSPRSPATRAPVSASLSAASRPRHGDRKSTRLNSSHQIISYAVFCLKKKKKVKYIIEFHLGSGGNITRATSKSSVT